MGSLAISTRTRSAREAINALDESHFASRAHPSVLRGFLQSALEVLDSDAPQLSINLATAPDALVLVISRDQMLAGEIGRTFDGFTAVSV